MAITLGQTDVGAIYLGGTQIYPTGSANKYTYTLTNVQVYYSDGGSILKSDGSNYVYFYGTFTVKRGSTTLSTETVRLNPKTIPTYTIKNSSGNLVWDTAKYGKTSVMGRTVSLSVNYGNATTLTSFALGANSKVVVGQECTLSVNNTYNSVTVPKSGGTFPIKAYAKITYRWSSGVGGDIVEEINNNLEFNFWSDGEDWCYVSGNNLIVNSNNSTLPTIRTTNVYCSVIGDEAVSAEIIVIQNRT